jgi:RNA polymerase sigma factor (sigma-70 family)
MDQQFETLDTYTNLAKKIISKFAPSFYSNLRQELLSNDEAIAEIAEAIMIADWRWDKDRTGYNGKSKTKYSYRNQCGLWAIKTYLSNRYKKKNMAYSIDSGLSDDQDSKKYVSNLAEKHSSDPYLLLAEKEEKELISSYIDNILSSEILSDKQKDQIYEYYFNEKTLLEIGNKYGVTREAVRQNIQKGLSKIRQYA